MLRGVSPRAVLLAAFAVFVAAFSGSVLMHKPTPPPFAPPPGYKFGQAVATTTTALFIGDSYAAGNGADSPSQNFAALTAAKLGWIDYIDAEGGTGFIAQGRQNSPTYDAYGARLQQDAANYKPDVIVVTGGRNDSAEPNAPEAATAYLLRVRAAWPKARMVIVAPFWKNADPPSELFTLRNSEKQDAARLHATFIDPLGEGWINSSNTARYLSSDGDHPNQAGHDYLATRLSDELKKAGVGSGTATA